MIDRTATLRSCTAMLLIALWAVQPLGAFVHSKEHAHRFCPTHQTFEEAEGNASQWQPGHTGSAPAISSLRWEYGVDLAPRSTHEACPVLTAGPRGDWLSSEAVTEIAVRRATSAAATAPPQSLSSLPLLATAPKSSPPARA